MKPMDNIKRKIAHCDECELSTFSDLPLEIQSNIMMFLPTNSISALSQTSRQIHKFVMANDNNDDDYDNTHSTTLSHKPSTLFKTSNIIWKTKFALKFPVTYEKYKNNKKIHWRDALKQASLYGLMSENRVQKFSNDPRWVLLPYFVKTGDLKEIKAIITKDNIDNIFQSRENNIHKTLLHIANINRQQEVLVYFYEQLRSSTLSLRIKGARINCSSHKMDQRSVAFFGVLFNNSDLTKSIITDIFKHKRSDEITNPNSLFIDMLALACEYQNRALVDELIDKGAEYLKQADVIFPEASLSSVAAFTSIEIIERLFDHDIDLFKEDVKAYYTAMEAAAVSGNYDVFAFFLDQTNFENNPHDWMCLLRAIISLNGQFYLNVSLMLRHAPTTLQFIEPDDIEQLTEWTFEVINYFPSETAEEWFRYCDHHFNKIDWSRIIHHAIDHKKYHMLDIILRMENIDVNLAVNKVFCNPADKITPLFSAVSCNDERIIRLLLENGADPHLPAKDDALSPLQFARSQNLVNIFALFERHTITSPSFK